MILYRIHCAFLRNGKRAAGRFDVTAATHGAAAKLAQAAMLCRGLEPEGWQDGHPIEVFNLDEAREQRQAALEAAFAEEATGA